MIIAAWLVFPKYLLFVVHAHLAVSCRAQGLRAEVPDIRSKDESKEIGKSFSDLGGTLLMWPREAIRSSNYDFIFMHAGSDYLPKAGLEWSRNDGMRQSALPVRIVRKVQCRLGL